MSAEIRLRRHTDGRVALSLIADWWMVTQGGPRDYCVLADVDVSGDGWSELFVAELPEPDGRIEGVQNTWTLYWDCAYIRHLIVSDGGDGVEVDGGMREDLNSVRSDALKMLAAATACERYRAEHGDNQ